ncbi:TadE/TadG family type IV pilus assembly protein [Rhodopseudomonas palustris]|uniref:TadE/TadG family type IV pilus assembly protein n=1 Tax=Rhodopseudomonas palustris TaxID=1076 RepID=UPI000E5AFE20|nr:TadE/TadG family type IV pilus assembly protein [Rhodopseudomonas palustris]QLH69927.1 pilus assembly protein [Rhodopseudomonas palustris]RIA03481.1 pilus assembly protein [Rhodopseudomonas palustris]
MIRRSVSVRSLQADVDAVAATEFAIVVPFLLALFIGGVELANGMAISVKVSATAHSVADMVTQNTSLSTTSMQNILTGATATIAPYSVNDSSGKSLLTVTVSEVSSDANGNLTLQWSRSFNGATFGSGRTSLSGLTVPTSLNGIVGNASNPNNQNDQVSFIVGEVSYAYTPNLGFAISGTVNLTDTVWMFPRCSTDSPANSNGPAYYDVKYSSSTTTCTCLQHLQYKNC